MANWVSSILVAQSYRHLYPEDKCESTQTTDKGAGIFQRYYLIFE